MTTVTDTRTDPRPPVAIRNGVHHARSEAVTDSRLDPRPASPRAVTCHLCSRDIPPDKNFVIVRRGHLTWRTEYLCWPCARGYEYPELVIPWLGPSARRAGRYSSEYVGVCAWCTRAFIGALARRHCSDECGEHARAARRDRTVDRSPRACDTCGELFTPPRSDGIYCSPACRQKAYRQRTRIGGMA